MSAEPLSPHRVFADADDEGFRFILPGETAEPAESAERSRGGLVRERGRGHFVTLVGRGGTGKSIFALQLLSQLLGTANGEVGDYHDYSHDEWPPTPAGHRHHAAFYFTLEASPAELVNQLHQFTWGKRVIGDYDQEPDIHADQWCHNGLNIVAVPSPTLGLGSLNRHIRQTIARQLGSIGRLVAIVVDPMGGIALREDLRSELSHLKQLSDTHRTFLILLAEDYIFERERSIEHFSQSIVHLAHDPGGHPTRRLLVQKARGQRFRPGHHQFELYPDVGARVFPSIQAQSAYAHEELARLQAESRKQEESRPGSTALTATPLLSFPSDDANPLQTYEVEPGSVVFLMGPPGTFKQEIASAFSAQASRADLYISFKADFVAVRKNRQGLGLKRAMRPFDRLSGRPDPAPTETWFLDDARDPLSTPEEILTSVRRTIETHQFSRAVVWGLRRLADMPNFAGTTAVEFLEALVTLLKSQQITSLLVDWPDIEKASTLPIVDLSQHILLSRVCRSRDSLTEAEQKDKRLVTDLKELWQRKEGAEHIAMLRVQRESGGFHRNKGSVFYRAGGSIGTFDLDQDDFDRFWLTCGVKWEQDPGLVQ